MLLTSDEKEGRKRDNQHFISFSELASASREKSRCQVFRKPERYGHDALELTSVNSFYEKPKKRDSFMIAMLTERCKGWALWRSCQSAAVGSSQVRFNNYFLIQKADHIERLLPQIISLRYALNPCQLYLLWTHSIKLSQQWFKHKMYTTEQRKVACNFW